MSIASMFFWNRPGYSPGCQPGYSLRLPGTVLRGNAFFLLGDFLDY